MSMATVDTAQVDHLVAQIRYGDEAAQYNAGFLVSSLSLQVHNRRLLGEGNVIGSILSVVGAVKPLVKVVLIDSLATLSLDGNYRLYKSYSF